MLTVLTVVETALYGDDLEALEVFYTNVFHFGRMAKEPGRHVFFQVGPGSVLLVFNPQATRQAGTLPAHGAVGPGHVAFGIPAESLDRWRHWLAENEVPIETELRWPAGGTSIYVRDPAGNSVELLTPGVWGTPAGW